VTISPSAPFLVADNSDGNGPFIEKWDESILGPRPTQAEIDAVDSVALQAEIDAKESDERNRHEWLKTVREKYAAMESDLERARTAFQTLKARYDKLENWAKTTKGYVP
jgi:flagellar motility protein MotE (MotC chaperone)